MNETRPTSEQLKRRIASLSPEHRALLEKRLIGKNGQATTESRIPRRSSNDPCPLSFCQQRLWFLDQLSPGNSTYNVPNAVRIRGTLNVAAFQKTIDEIVNRHEVLRTNFQLVEGVPVQVISNQREALLRIVDLAGMPVGERDVELRRCLEVEARLPFDLSRDLMFRPTLYRLSDDEYVFQLMTHHVAWDAWSKAVVYREIATLYEAYSCGESARLPDLPIQYADFACWQRDWLRGRVYEEQVAYWKRQLHGARFRLDLPTDRARPPIQTYDGAKFHFVLPTSLAELAKSLSRHEGVTLFMTLLSAFEFFLYERTGQQNICIGSPLAGRNRVETEGVVGFFINTMVLRTDLTGNPSFRELLRRVRETTLGAYAHPDLPFEKLVEVMRVPRDPARNPLFQVNFRVQTAPSPPLRLAGVDVIPLELIDTATSKFDLALELSALEGFGGYLEYNTNLFDESTIVRMRDDFEKLLERLLTNPDTRLDEIRTNDNKNEGSAMTNISPSSGVSGPGGMRRKAVSASSDMIKSGPVLPGKSLPLMMQPAIEGVDLAEWAANNRDTIETQLHKHGAILFRGFNLKSPADFERVMTAICKELYDEYGDLPREGVAGKIYGSTWYPSDKTILFHNESSHLSRWPQKIAFFCVKASESGGETPLLDCREVCKRLDASVLEKFAAKGLLYVRNFSPGLDVSWQKFFHTEDRKEVESACKDAGMTCEWVGTDGLRVGQVCRAVVNHPKTNERVFFNQVQLHHVFCLDDETRSSLLKLFTERELPRHVYFGDGSPIDDGLIKELGELYWNTAVAIPWQEGDMILLDNMLVAHARNPYQGQRKIVVAMGEMIDASQLN